MRERWHDIPDYEGVYQVSTRGRVRALTRIDASKRWRIGHVLQAEPRSNGRRYFMLCKNGRTRSYEASVLLALAYGVPNPDNLRYVIHRNGKQSNFRRNNLQWATLAELRMADGRKVSTGYYGVTLNKKGGVLRWIMQLRHGDERIWKAFVTPEEAAYAYDQTVKRLGLERPLNHVRKPKRSGPAPIESLPGERWRPFPGAEDAYLISNRARVRTCEYVTANGSRVFPRLRKVTVDKHGCRTILIRGKRYGIAKLVEQVFSAARQRRDRA